MPSTIAHALGVQVSGQELPLDRVREHVRDKRMLLVLDNFEQVLGAAPAVSTLLAAAPTLSVLTSSRAPLRIDGEQELPVPPLDLPDPERLPSLEVLAQSDAVRLFVERAQAVRPDFRVTAENAPAVAEIVFHLEGLPLAIELAAARVKLLTPQAMLPRLKQGLDLLASGARDRTDRQRTLRGAIAWSYDLLDPGMQRLFARCAVFVGGAQLDELEVVCGPAGELGRDVLDGLSELVDQSLLRRLEAEGEPRFRMLVTIRDFALERLAAGGEERTLRDRHLAAYLALAERAQPELQGAEQKRWADRLELEHDNLRAALDHAIAVRRGNEAARLSAALWRFWQVRGHLREGLARVEQMLALPELAPDDRLRALEAAGGLTYWMGDPRMAAYYEDALGLARDLGRPDTIARALYNLAFAFIVPGTDRARALVLLEESLALSRGLGDRAAAGRAAFALAGALSQGQDRSHADLLRAREAAAEALAAHRDLGNQFDLGWDLHMSAFVALKLGDLAAAEQGWTEAMRLFVAAGDASGVVLLLSNFAELAKARGDLERHDTLVGAWTALAARTGAGLTSLFGINEGRELAADITGPRRAAVERGLAMGQPEAIAYALGTKGASPDTA